MTLTFHGNPDLKCALIRRAQMHREADRLTQGFSYMTRVDARTAKDIGTFKGCAIGCLATPVNVSDEMVRSLSKYTHASLQQEDCTRILNDDFGLPEFLVLQAEVVFEGLLAVNAQPWPERFVRAIPVGVEVPPLRKRFTNSDKSYEEDADDIVAWLTRLAPDQPQPTCPPVELAQPKVPVGV